MATVRKRTWESGGKTRAAWIVDYRDQYGKRRLKTFKRKKDADAFETEARHEVRQGTHTPDSTAKTVAEAAEEWIKGREPNVERSTLRSYRQHVNLHIAPLIGEVKLSKLTKPVANSFRDRLVSGEGTPDGKRSRAMAQKVLQSFRSLIADAHGRGSVAQDVARGVTIRASKRDKREIAIPTQEEAKAMLETVDGHWRPLIVTAIFTGMRASELRGLTWANVDLKKNVIHVRQRADRWNVIGEPKSDSSRRDIPMPPMVVNTLKAWKLACPVGDLDLVFPNGRGSVEALANIWKRGFEPLQKKCGIVGKDGKPKYGLHALRHFYASWLIDRGFAPKKVQTFMGHSTITMTMDTYAKLFESLEDDHDKLAAGEMSLMGA